MYFLQRVARSVHGSGMSSRPRGLTSSMTIAPNPFHFVPGLLMYKCLPTTAASINQHPTRNNEGYSRERVSLNQNVKLKRLADWYIEVQPYNLRNDTPVLVCGKPSTTEMRIFNKSIQFKRQ